MERMFSRSESSRLLSGSESLVAQDGTKRRLGYFCKVVMVTLPSHYDWNKELDNLPPANDGQSSGSSSLMEEPAAGLEVYSGNRLLLSTVT